MLKTPTVRVLTIEDDPTVAEEIAAELNVNGFSVEIVGDGRVGLEKACTGSYDAITLDRMLPGLDGLSVVTRLRAAGVDTPVLMISAMSDVDERIRGLRTGGDDYLVKPFAADEMCARLEVMLRRRKEPIQAAKLQVDDLEMDLISRTVRRNGVLLELKQIEFKLLEYLMRNSGQILTRTMIFEAVWNYHFDPYTNLIEVHIGRLRKRVDTPEVPALIHTVWGTGYLLGQRS